MARWLEAWLLLAILIAGLLLRLGLLLTTLAPVESDEASVGLVALHILQGARPVFDYGETDQGALPAYLSAPAMAALGPSGLSLRLAPLVLSTAFVYAIYALGRAMYDRNVGLLSAAWVAFGPTMLIIWGFKAGAGYVEVITLGTLALALTASVAWEGRREPWRYAGIGLLCGLALWTHAVAAYYLLAIVLVVVVARWAVSGRSNVQISPGLVPSLGLWGAAVGSFAVGLLPLIWANLHQGLPTLEVLLMAGPTGGGGRLHLGPLVGESLPVLLGLLQPSSSPELFATQAAQHPWRQVAGVGLAAALAVAMVARLTSGLIRPSWWRFAAVRDVPLLTFVVLPPLFFAVSRYSFVTGEPRYLMPAYTAVPLFVALAVGHRRRTLRLAMALVLVAFMAFNLRANLGIDPRLNLPFLCGRSLISSAELIDFLQDHGLDRFYGDYWVTLRVSFETGERIIGSAITPDNRLGWNRYPPHGALVEASPRPAYVFVAGCPGEEQFATRLRDEGISYRRARAADYAVYYDLSRPVRFSF